MIGNLSEDPRLDADPISDGDAGLDLKWGVSRSLALDLTYNTDFAEVEVDQLQTNLTRFSLYFPEKRDFFLENAGIFDYGPPHREFFRPPVLKAFFSRRVGLEDGRQVPIDWGVRLTGRLGGWNVGVLRVATAGLAPDDGDLPANAFTVARLKRNLGRRSTVGAIVTEAAPENEDANRVVGLDFDYKPTSKLSVGGFWTSSGLSEEPVGGEADGSADTGEAAYGVNFDYQGRALTVFMDAQEIKENYRPMAGFLLRKNVRHLNPQIQWLPRIERGLVRSWFTEMRYDYYETLDEGKLESSRLEISPLGMRMTTEDRWRLSYVGEEENLIEPFEIASGHRHPGRSLRLRRLRARHVQQPEPPPRRPGPARLGRLSTTAPGHLSASRSASAPQSTCRPRACGSTTMSNCPRARSPSDCSVSRWTSPSLPTSGSTRSSSTTTTPRTWA